MTITFSSLVAKYAHLSGKPAPAQFSCKYINIFCICFFRSTMEVWASVKQWFILHLLIGYIFLTSGVIVCFLMFLASIFVWPFNKTLYRKIVCNLGYTIWSRKYCFVCYDANYNILAVAIAPYFFFFGSFTSQN